MTCLRCGKPGHEPANCTEKVGHTQLCLAVVAYLRRGPRTADELAYALRVYPHTVMRYLRAGSAVGLVRPIGVRPTGKAGPSPMLWEVVFPWPT
jgi:predicted ArsR family transcriptional regulator